MEQLIKLLPSGGAAVCVIVVVVIFLKKFETTIARLCDSQEKARDSYFLSLRELMVSHERIQIQFAERFKGFEEALEHFTEAVEELKRR